MSDTPPISGIARKTRSDRGVLRKSSMDTFADLFRRMSPSEQSTALEVLRQIQRLGHAGYESDVKFQGLDPKVTIPNIEQ